MKISTKQSLKSYSTHHFLGLGFHGFHRIHYLEWGTPPKGTRKETLVCVHGITRNAHDFDYFAEHMCDKYRVICPDVVGRGESDHLPDHQGYDYLQYNADMNALLARLNETQVDWLGSSMGGIIGMVLASVAQSPIRRLIINDIGPEISREPLTRIGDYIGKSGEFDTPEDVEKYFREIYSEFGPMSDDDWKHMVHFSTRRTKTGKYRLKMDPSVGDAFRDSISLFDVDLWETWEKITCPVLILRGKNSSFLSEEIAHKMLTCGPEATLVEFDDVGHTPTLRNEEQVAVIRNWMAEN
jgi:pimeloyl-ACP methyl ester carboxylesterase